MIAFANDIEHTGNSFLLGRLATGADVFCIVF